MVKKSFAALLLASLMLGSTSVAAPAQPRENGDSPRVPSNSRIELNGAALALGEPAYVLNDVTMVPLRQIAEALGAVVGWGTDGQGRAYAKLTRGGRSATVTAGSATMTVDGRAVKLDAAPEVRSGAMRVPLRALSEALGTIVSWDGIGKIIHIDDPKQLPTIGTPEKLEQLLKEIRQQVGVYEKNGGIVAMDDAGAVDFGDKATAVQPAAPAAESASGSAAPGSGGDYSRTNVQVEGVDEADTAKTDGKFVYQISGSRLFVSSIANPDAPKLAATLDYSKDDFYPIELYVGDGRLVVIGQRSLPLAVPYTGVAPEAASSASSSAVSGAKADMSIMPVRPTRTTVQTKVYSLADDGKPSLTRETELEGNYVSSRKIDGALYVVANKYNYYSYLYAPAEKRLSDGADAASTAEAYQPAYGDSASSKELKTLPLGDIRYFPGTTDTSTMLIGALDLDRPAQPFQVSAYLGSGQTIYASEKHLYVAIGKSEQDGENGYKSVTQLYKFRLDQGNVVYVGEGSVPGTILNQYAMDESKGYFRIATTNDSWTNGKSNQTNNLYVLDEQMGTIGKLENLAPGERIYSTRFMGTRAYMVTFRNVDPLFAIDLRDPTKPAVLGQLKIPGYSDYLHPYDDTHLIGFGKETVEVPSKGAGPDATMAFYQGMKLALFDVSDVNNPKEMFKEVIGDRGTNSELLYNPKALLFSKDKGLLAFPVELMEIPDGYAVEDGGFPAYGQFVYQGAYVYGIDLAKGFTLRGRITHLSQDELAKSGQFGYDYSKTVHRILYANGSLYTLSDRMLKANDLGSLRERGTLTYPAAPEGQPPYYGPAIDVAPALSAPAE